MSTCNSASFTGSEGKSKKTLYIKNKKTKVTAKIIILRAFFKCEFLLNLIALINN